jgi:hypothetical protein
LGKVQSLLGATKAKEKEEDLRMALKEKEQQKKVGELKKQKEELGKVFLQSNYFCGKGMQR